MLVGQHSRNRDEKEPDVQDAAQQTARVAMIHIQQDEPERDVQRWKEIERLVQQAKSVEHLAEPANSMRPLECKTQRHEQEECAGNQQREADSAYQGRQL